MHLVGQAGQFTTLSHHPLVAVLLLSVCQVALFGPVRPQWIGPGVTSFFNAFCAHASCVLEVWCASLRYGKHLQVPSLRLAQQNNWDRRVQCHDCLVFC